MSPTSAAVADNLADVRRRIDAACVQAGRDPAEVRLLPVSKRQPATAVEQAYAAGVRTFGENRVQELADKAEQLADRCPDLRWAMIGHVQSNKARQVADLAAELHSLDSLRLAELLHRRLYERDAELDVFVQVNSSAEPQKSGLAPSAVADFVAELRRYPTLRVRGLMTLAVFSSDQRAVAACFESMRDLGQRLQLPELSMGMSGDFELAIAYGATTVRVGEAIFGPRG